MAAPVHPELSHRKGKARDLRPGDVFRAPRHYTWRCAVGVEINTEFSLTAAVVVHVLGEDSPWVYPPESPVLIWDRADA